MAICSPRSHVACRIVYSLPAVRIDAWRTLRGGEVSLTCLDNNALFWTRKLKLFFSTATRRKAETCDSGAAMLATQRFRCRRI